MQAKMKTEGSPGFDYKVFFGFSVEKSDLEIIKSLSPYLRDLFIQNRDLNYLQFVRFEESLYLGKYLDEEVSIETLESMKKNILTIAKNLSDRLFSEQREPVLFPVPFPPESDSFPE